jgi:hypothetical protein
MKESIRNCNRPRFKFGEEIGSLFIYYNLFNLESTHAVIISCDNFFKILGGDRSFLDKSGVISVLEFPKVVNFGKLQPMKIISATPMSGV